MPIRLGLNLNPFVNRFAEPGAPIDKIAEEIGAGYVTPTSAPPSSRTPPVADHA